MAIEEALDLVCQGIDILVLVGKYRVNGGD
jgi:hypothetical protein